MRQLTSLRLAKGVLPCLLIIIAYKYLYNDVKVSPQWITVSSGNAIYACYQQIEILMPDYNIYMRVYGESIKLAVSWYGLDLLLLHELQHIYYKYDK